MGETWWNHVKPMGERGPQHCPFGPAISMEPTQQCQPKISLHWRPRSCVSLSERSNEPRWIQGASWCIYLMSPCCACCVRKLAKSMSWSFQSMESWVNGAAFARPPISLAPKPNSPTKAVRYSSKRLPSRLVSRPSCVTRLLLLWCIQWCWNMLKAMGCDGLHDGLHMPKASKHTSWFYWESTW